MTGWDRVPQRSGLAWLASWRVIVAVLVSVLAAGVAGVLSLQQQIQIRAVGEAVLSARVVSSLVVARNITIANIAAGTVSEASKADMDADVAKLVEHHELSGLEVWSLRTGVLVYADAGHSQDETIMPVDELTRARSGRVFTQVTDDGGRAGNSLDVFLPYDADGDGSAEAVVEALQPRDPIEGTITRSTRILYGAAALVVVLAAVGLMLLRRRQHAHEYAATHDGLTDVGNRSQLARAAAAAFAERHDPQRIGLLLLDLDRFKEVNDTLGHHAGDDLLIAVAGRLRGACRHTDTVVRLGGDEFAVLTPSIGNANEAASLAQNILDALHQPIALGDLLVEVGGSIGAAIAPDHGEDLQTLLRCADVAMYDAKRHGGGVLIYDAATDPRESGQLTMLAELRKGITEGQLRLYYQPKASITGSISQVEALVRWQHPRRGLLMPADFIPLAERTSLIKPLTSWVLTEAANQYARWLAAGHDLQVAVNVSPRCLTEELPNQILAAAGTARIPASRLQIEVTETAVMTDPDRARRVLQRLRAMGISVSIDDFGVGYTSLSYLTELPVDELKIDRRFIANMLNNDADEAIVRGIINLSRELGMRSLAEGVDSDLTWARLADLGCNDIQGFVLTPALPADDLLTWLTEWQGHTTATHAPGRPRGADM
jgi:diguanylate cyclase (GGDEF)-like protein